MIKVLEYSSLLRIETGLENPEDKSKIEGDPTPSPDAPSMT